MGIKDSLYCNYFFIYTKVSRQEIIIYNEK